MAYSNTVLKKIYVFYISIYKSMVAQEATGIGGGAMHAHSFGGFRIVSFIQFSVSSVQYSSVRGENVAAWTCGDDDAEFDMHSAVQYRMYGSSEVRLIWILRGEACGCCRLTVCNAMFCDVMRCMDGMLRYDVMRCDLQRRIFWPDYRVRRKGGWPN